MHDASDGSTGHWNPDTTIEPEVRFEAVTVSIKDCEPPSVTVNDGLDVEIEKLGPNWLISTETFGVPSPVARS